MVSQESLINCPQCKNKYDSPRILPCLESICINCVLQNENDGLFECPFCKQVHHMPFEGFPLNKSLLKIIKAVESTLHKSSYHEELRGSIDKIQELIDYLDCDYEAAKSKIKNHCDDLRNRININIESEIKFLNDIRDELFDEIYVYEKDCLVNLDNNSELLNNNQASIKDSKIFLDNENSNFKKTKLDEDSIRDKICRVKQIEWRLHGQKKKLKNCLFNSVNLIYRAGEYSRSPSLIKKKYKEIDFDEYKVIDLKEILNNDNELEYLNVRQLKNKNFVLGYSDTIKSKIEIRSFDKSKMLFKRYTRPFLSKFSNRLLKTFGNKIIHYEYTDESSLFLVFDENLEILHENETSSIYKDILVSDSKILCLSLDRNAITIYDWNFNKIMMVNKNSSLFNFTENILGFYSNDEYFFFHEPSLLNIISKEDGRLLKSIRLNYNDEIIGINSTSLFLKADYSKLITNLDFNGNIITTIKMRNFSHSNFEFLLDVDLNFSFFDPTVEKLFITNE